MNFCCDDERISNAVRDCDWRHEFDGIDVCRGMCSPCLNEIDKGTCPTLREYFKRGDKNEPYSI